MVIKQGDIYWIDLEEPVGSEPGYRHPHVIIQNNVFNASQVWWAKAVSFAHACHDLAIIAIDMLCALCAVESDFLFFRNYLPPPKKSANI